MTVKVISMLILKKLTLTSSLSFFKNLNKSSAKNKEFHNNIPNNLNTLIGNHTANINNAEFNTPLREEEILKTVKSLEKHLRLILFPMK